MSNTWDLWNQWKEDLSPYYKKAETGLLGKKDIVAGKDMGTRSGGIFGGDGVYDRGIEYAGKKFDEVKNTTVDQVKDYALGEDKLVSSPSIGETERPGFKKSQMNKDIHSALDTGIEYFDKGVKKTQSVLDQKLEEYFPNFANNKSVSEAEKSKLVAGYENGQVDPNLIKALEKKTSPINEDDKGTLEKIIGMDFDTASKNWKDKGGFEGLMANPAFSLGLALMQSSANGKTINQGILDNFVKSAKISSEFKDRIKARTQVLGPPSDAERDMAEAALSTIGITGPGMMSKGWDFIKLWGKDNQAIYKRGLNSVVVQAKQIIDKKYKGKTHTVTEQDYIDAFNQLKKEGKLKDTQTIFGTTIENINKNKKKKSWLQEKAESIIGEESKFFKAEGGPVAAGKPYMVGEKGPEIIIPRSDGNVLSNDDSQIYAMLLASNPQLQKVSRQRAEKILRNRFPEYFEG